MADKSIVDATTKNCIVYQMTAAGYYRDADFHRSKGEPAAAKICQQHAARYYQAAWDRLARLIGVE